VLLPSNLQMPLSSAGMTAALFTSTLIGATKSLLIPEQLDSPLSTPCGIQEISFGMLAKPTAGENILTGPTAEMVSLSDGANIWRTRGTCSTRNGGTNFGIVLLATLCACCPSCKDKNKHPSIWRLASSTPLGHPHSTDPQQIVPDGSANIGHGRVSRTLPCARPLKPV